MYNNTTYGWRQSTLAFAAVDPSTGTTGFVIAGHAAINAGGIGGDIFQGSTTRQVGEVDYLTGHFADAAWVEADNVEPVIYYDDVEDLREVRSYDDDELNIGSKVYMSGITTGLTSGHITEYHDEQDSDTFGTLYCQYSADYDSAAGDSGAPVFKKWGNEVRLVGVHRGYYDEYASFSPISGVILDLGVEPLTN